MPLLHTTNANFAAFRVYVLEPTDTKAAYFMYASNGIITAMLNKVDEFAARQFTDLVDYNSTTNC